MAHPLSARAPLSHTFSTFLSLQSRFASSLSTKEDLAAAQGPRLPEPPVSWAVSPGSTTLRCQPGTGWQDARPIQVEVSRGGQTHPQICLELTLGFPSEQLVCPVSILFLVPGKERQSGPPEVVVVRMVPVEPRGGDARPQPGLFCSEPEMPGQQ